MKVAAYVRVSSYNQKQTGDSISGQKEYIKNWAYLTGNEIIKWYIDESASAFRDLRRYNFNLMLQDIENPNSEIEAIVVYNLSRFSRNLKNQLTAQNLLETYNVRLISASEGIPDDHNTARLHTSFLGILNEHYSRQNSAVVTDRLQDTARKGYFCGGPIPLGYISVEIEGDTSKKRKVLAVNDDEAPIVKEIFSLAEKGIDGKPMGVKAISIYMNNKGVLNRGKRWNRNSIDRVLTRRDYFGEHIHGKNRDPRKGLEPIIVNVPAIINKDQFFNVQDGLKSRGLKNNENKCYRSDSLLVGMLKCSICNSNMVVVSGKGGKYKYYECSKKIRQDVKSCSSKMLPKPLIDNAVRRLLSERVITEDNINYIYKDLKSRIRNLVEKSARNVASINRRINNNNFKVNNIIEQIASRQLEPNAQINKYISDKRNELESLNRELVTALKGTKLPIKQFGQTQVAQLVKNLKEIVLTGDEARVKQILLILLKEVEITPQKKISILGFNMALVFLASHAKTGTDFSVPVIDTIWRRDRDLNPRYAINVCRFSRPVLSTTQPSLHKLSSSD